MDVFPFLRRRVSHGGPRPWVCRMPEGFGARLRKQREERQIDLSWVAEQTKIKRSLLEALERDDVSHWPSGIFRRAYVRTYAHIIGLDPDVVVREFLQVHPEPVDMWEAAAAAAFEEEAARRNAALGLRPAHHGGLGDWFAGQTAPPWCDRRNAARPPLTAPVPSVFAPPAAPTALRSPPWSTRSNWNTRRSWKLRRKCKRAGAGSRDRREGNARTGGGIGTCGGGNAGGCGGK